MSNTFVKILAAGLKLTLCRLVDSRLHPAQKCISGRLMMDNVLLVDIAMHCLAISGSAWAPAFFFDFIIA